MVRVGTSGYAYDAWVGEFYSGKRPTLVEYAKSFDCVEVNATFYRSVSATAMQRWARETPPDFAFVLKGPRSVSHAAAGKHCGALVEAFCSSSATALGAKLAGVLWQLPARAALDVKGLCEVCEVTAAICGYCAVELRGQKWLDADVVERVEAAGGHVVRSLASTWETVILSDAVSYWRLHGPRKLYASDYSEEQLVKLAAEMCGKRGFAFFNNDCGGYAFRNAARLRSVLA